MERMDPLRDSHHNTPTVISVIQKLGEEHRSMLMDLVSKEPEYNLFIMGDVENFGLESGFLEVWGNIDTGRMTSVLLRYYSYFIYYSPYDEDVSPYVSIMSEHENFELLSGKPECAERFIPHFSFKKITRMIMVKLDEQMFKTTSNMSNISLVRKASLADAKGIFDLQSSIQELLELSPNYENIRRSIEKESGRYFIIKDDEGRVISCAGSTAESQQFAVIVAVMTHPGYRGKGFATRCIESVCHDLLREGKSIYLFYDNPEAGRIYRKVGFKEIGKWCVCIK